jgi:preprotein translocase subunit SecA
MLKNPFKKSSLNKYQNLINQINTFESELTVLSDSDLRAKSLKLKNNIEKIKI